MALKAIIQVDIDDSAFQEFLKNFKDNMDKINLSFENISVTLNTMVNNYNSINTIINTQNNMLIVQNHYYAAANRATSGIAGNTLQIAKNIVKTTESLLKWVGIGGVLGGLLGVGGLFGLDKLAEAVGNSRKEAGGLGITSGQLQAANINFGRYINVNSVLGGIASAQTNENLWAFRALGINPDGKDPAQLMAELNLKAQAVYKPLQGKPMAERYPQVQALESLGYSITDLRMLARASTGELRGATTAYGSDATRLQLSPQAQLGWQLFTAQLARTGQQLENLLGKHLIALAPALETLSASVVKTVDKLISSGKFDEWINDFAHGIEVLGKYLGSDKFQNDVKEFATNFGLVVDKLIAGLRLLGVIPDPTVATPDDIVATTSHPSRRQLGQESAIMKFFTGRGWSPVNAAGISVNDWYESGMDPFAQNGSHYGLAQWDATRQKKYAKMFGHTMQSVTDRNKALAEQLMFQDAELHENRWTGPYGAVGDKLAGYQTAGGSAYYLNDAYEFSSKDPQIRDALGKQRASAAGVLLQFNINNNTGGNSSVQLNQAAAAMMQGYSTIG